LRRSISFLASSKGHALEASAAWRKVCDDILFSFVLCPPVQSPVHWKSTTVNEAPEANLS
jgi:hypothetical protein